MPQLVFLLLKPRYCPIFVNNTFLGQPMTASQFGLTQYLLVPATKLIHLHTVWQQLQQSVIKQIWGQNRNGYACINCSRMNLQLQVGMRVT